MILKSNNEWPCKDLNSKEFWLPLDLGGQWQVWVTWWSFQRKNGPFSHNLKCKDIICTKGKQAWENPYQVINNDVWNLLHSTLSFAVKSFLLLQSWVIFVIQYYLDFLHNQNWIKVWDLIILKKLYSYFVVPTLKKQKPNTYMSY